MNFRLKLMALLADRNEIRLDDLCLDLCAIWRAAPEILMNKANDPPQFVSSRRWLLSFGGMALASALVNIAAKSKLMSDEESSVRDFVIVNGWVLTAKDNLLRKRQR